MDLASSAARGCNPAPIWSRPSPRGYGGGASFHPLHGRLTDAQRGKPSLFLRLSFSPREGFSSLRLLLRHFSLHKRFAREISPSGCVFVLFR